MDEPIATHDVRGGGGLRLHVREWGNPQGPPIVFVHGWSQSQLCWSRQIAGPLAEDFRLVTFDLRGHGMSEKPLDAGQYVDARLWADDLDAVIEQLELDRPTLVAWSYGGFVVTDYVRAYGEDGDRRDRPRRRRGAAHARLRPHRSGPARERGRRVRPRPAGEHRGDAALPARLHGPAARRPDDWSTALCWNMVVPPEVRGALFAREIDADDVLSRLSVPVLVTHGLADTIVLPSMAEHVLEVCPTARASWYEGVGHLPFLEDPARFDRELAEFAGRVG